MPLSSNVSITLDAHSPKTKATGATDGSHTTGPNDVTLWAASGVEVGNRTEVIATFQKLLAWAMSNLNTLQPSAGPSIVHGPLSPEDSDIQADGIPTAEECRIEIGATLVDKEQSHFIDRTVKRLLEVMLEVSKGPFTLPSGAGGAGGPSIGSSAQDSKRASFNLGGLWPPGTRVRTRITTWDPDGDEDMQEVITTIPPGSPPEGWDAATAASVIAADIDPQPHARASASGTVVTVEVADPDYTIAVQMAVI